MEKTFYTAKEARQLMETTGLEYFRNQVFKRIREEASEGYNCMHHCFGEQGYTVDLAIVEEIRTELESKGYKVTVSFPEDGAWEYKISW